MEVHSVRQSAVGVRERRPYLRLIVAISPVGHHGLPLIVLCGLALVFNVISADATDQGPRRVVSALRLRRSPGIRGSAVGMRP